jgi:hypothetical protein
LSYPNGKVPTTLLKTWSGGTPLLSATYGALKSLALLAEIQGIAVRPASGLGSGYRDIACQKIFYDGSRGNVHDAQLADLNPNSIIRVATPGSSSHGYGDRVDLVFNGSASPSKLDLALANHCGFVREFGAEDPNHFRHDGRTATGGPSAADWRRIVAHYLNGRHLGETSTTEQDGIVDRSRPQHYTWEVQAAGIHDRLYASPPLLHDGIPGPHTDGVEAHYRAVLWASVG